MRVLGYLLLVLGVVFVLSFIGTIKVGLSLYESNSIEDFSKYSFILIQISILFAGLILILKGVDWGVKNKRPVYEKSNLRVTFGYVFYILGYFFSLNLVVQILRVYFLKESIAPILFTTLFAFICYHFAMKWTKKKAILEIDKIGGSLKE